ncbi:MAG: transcriptional repressor [Nitratiruptor sp.]|nr:transcriptional repressor [Nitratiruptor sp.]NPA83242.1 transcriptional repressor [Campylobacterota bacterium]
MEKGFEDYLDELRDKIRRRGLKHSQQREEILKVLFHAKGHLTPEEIYARLRTSGIGLATIYRTLALLEEEEMVRSISFDNEGRRYELNRGGHHDHLICLGCGAIVEFYDEALEQLQEKIARQAGFTLITHQLNLYGLCATCRLKGDR